MADFSSLIPELKDWNNGAGIDVESWIGCVGDFQKAIGYSTIFWPQFAEVDGFVVYRGTTREVLQEWLESCKGDRKAVEALVNHLHLVDIHYYGCPDATPERLAFLGRVLKEIYECKLRCRFPGKRFTVRLDDGPSEDLYDYILTFYQEDDVG